MKLSKNPPPDHKEGSGEFIGSFVQTFVAERLWKNSHASLRNNKNPTKKIFMRGIKTNRVFRKRPVIVEDINPSNRLCRLVIMLDPAWRWWYNAQALIEREDTKVTAFRASLSVFFYYCCRRILWYWPFSPLSLSYAFYSPDYLPECLFMSSACAIPATPLLYDRCVQTILIYTQIYLKILAFFSIRVCEMTTNSLARIQTVRHSINDHTHSSQSTFSHYSGNNQRANCVFFSSLSLDLNWKTSTYWCFWVGLFN